NPTRIAYLGSFVPQLEKLGAQVINRRHDQGSVQEVILLLTGSLGDEQAAVACGAKKKSALMSIVGFVLGTDRVIGTQAAALQGFLQVMGNLAAGFDQSA